VSSRDLQDDPDRAADRQQDRRVQQSVRHEHVHRDEHGSDHEVVDEAEIGTGQRHCGVAHEDERLTEGHDQVVADDLR
jgi:hypothetical protein